MIVNAAAEVAAATGKPVLVFSNIANGIEPSVKRRADAAGLPLLQGTRASLRAIQALIRYAALRRCPPEAAAPSPAGAAALDRIKRGLAAEPPTLTERAGKRVLAAYGIPVTREALARSAEEAVELAAGFGGPVALKIESPDIPHKTEAGGVLLNLCGPADVRRGFELILANAAGYKGDARVEGVLVQAMVPPGAVEVIAGTSNDPDFGPVVVFGLGGVLVELLKDSSLRLAPVGPGEAREMIAATRARPCCAATVGARPPTWRRWPMPCAGSRIWRMICATRCWPWTSTRSWSCRKGTASSPPMR